MDSIASPGKEPSMQNSTFESNRCARRGFASLRELFVLAALICAVVWGLDGAQQALKLQRPRVSTAPMPVHGLTVDDGGKHLWVMRRRDGLGRVSLPDFEECDFTPIDPDPCGFALCSAAGHTIFACVRLNGMAEIHVDGRRIVEQRIAEPKRLNAAVAISDDGRTVVAATNQGIVHRWTRDANDFIHDIRSSDATAERVALDRTGRFLALLNNRTDVCIWDLERDAFRSRWELGHPFCSALALSGDGDRLATVGSDRKLRVWESPAGRLLWEYEADALDPYGVSFSPCGCRLVTGGFDNRVRLWDVATGRLIAEHTGHQLPVRVFAWAADSLTVFSSGLDGRVRAWPVSAMAHQEPRAQ
jgi:WD40 repeat protein